MFSDEDMKDMPGSHLLQSGDEIISIREVCLSDKSDRRDLGFHSEPLLASSSRSDDVTRSLFRDGFFPEGLEPQQARFAWTEEDGNIASFVSESGFGTAPTFGKDLDVGELKEADTSTPPYPSTVMCRNGLMFTRKPAVDSHLVSSTSSLNERGKSQGPCKVDKTDPRSRFHYVKYVKRHGRNVKLWECGICGREFQHQYTLMRHLPTHTDERNFHCSACGKSFRQLSTLSQHRAIHSAERPYSCEVCKKTFNRVSTLISHRKTHSDEKPYRCHICPKGFHQKGNLRNHLFTHTNERPYRCNICMKGFNQQSNLVCHKNKAHPEDGCVSVVRRRSSQRLLRPAPEQPDSTRPPPPEQCEVSSSVGPYLPAIEGPSTSNWIPPPSSQSVPWDMPKLSPAPDIWTNDMSWGSGVIVDPIKTYPMSVALATKQTPFALLKADNNSPPVLVKVVDTNLPGGKQMLVPATAEDLRVGGKIVVKNEDGTPNEDEEAMAGAGNEGAVQIRVPVVATVEPRARPGGRLQLLVRAPHRPRRPRHAALSSDVMPLGACSGAHQHVPPPPPLQRRDPCPGYSDDSLISAGSRISSTCTLPPPAPSPPSPPLDLIAMDLFEPMECIPLGPQITAVDHIDRPPHSDDSDIFIGEFEEDLPLSDSE